MRIGELSTRTGVSARSLRYYEDQGLLVSSRAASGQRHYTDDHVQRVALIQAFLAAGLSSRTTAEMVPCMTEPNRREAERASTTMTYERDRLSSAIDGLIAARAALEILIDVNRNYLIEHAADPAAHPPDPRAGARPTG